MHKEITALSTVEDVVREYPDTIDVFMDFSMNPIVCGDPVWGTIGEEADKNNVDVDSLLMELNKIIRE